MPLSRIKPQMESSQLRLDSSAASTDVNERVLLDGTDSSDTNDGYAVILEDATANAFDGGPFVLSETPISVANPAFKAFRAGSTQAISDATETKMALGAVLYDVGGYYDNVTNYRYTPLIAGYYHIVLSAQLGNLVDCDDIILRIFKNGAVAGASQTRIHLTSLTNEDLFASNIHTSDVIHMNGTTDYIEGFMTIVSEDGGTPQINFNDHRTYLEGHLLTRTS